MTNIFEQASRKKLRFATNRGAISTEDLWDLSLEELDSIAKTLDKTVNDAGKSFIKKKDTVNRTASLQLEVVVSVINTKMEEADRRAAAAERKIKRDKIINLIADKEAAKLQNKSLPALQAELSKLDEEEDTEE